eukprot:scaffold290141_cov15-Tisochrysis_lutea.AAC.1
MGCNARETRYWAPLPKQGWNVTVQPSDLGSDFTKTGVNDIAVARDDGTLEIYDLDEAGNLQQ